MMNSYISFNHKTSKYSFPVHSLFASVETSTIKSNYKDFSNLCKDGCKNFGKKYSCPPNSPDFSNIVNKYNFIVINILKILTSELPQRYNTIRMTNVVAKSIQKLAFNNLEYTLTEYPFNFYFLENGSCRLCKTCKLQEDLNCKYPQKMRPSLEATGIDVNDLVNKAFGFNLQWYNRDYFPQYQCVVGGILSNEPEMIKRELSDFYTTNYLAISSKGTRVTKQLLEEIVI